MEGKVEAVVPRDQRVQVARLNMRYMFLSIITCNTVRPSSCDNDPHKCRHVRTSGLGIDKLCQSAAIQTDTFPESQLH